jgi:hypothetical protein
MADVFANMASLLQNGFQIAIQDCYSVQRVSPIFFTCCNIVYPRRADFQRWAGFFLISAAPRLETTTCCMLGSMYTTLPCSRHFWLPAQGYPTAVDLTCVACA